MNKVLVCFCLMCIFVSPVFGQEFGSAVINSVPDSADVYFDGFYFGKTPLSASYMLPGKYVLTVCCKGYNSLTKELDIKAGCGNYQDLLLKEGQDTIKKNLIWTRPSNTSSSAYKEGDSVAIKKIPELIKTTKPNYPQLAKFHNIEGIVYLNVLIGCDGTPELIVFAKSSGAFCLDYEALKAAYQLKFRPAICEDEKPTMVWVMWPVTFSLRPGY